MERVTVSDTVKTRRAAEGLIVENVDMWRGVGIGKLFETASESRETVQDWFHKDSKGFRKLWGSMLLRQLQMVVSWFKKGFTEFRIQGV